MLQLLALAVALIVATCLCFVGLAVLCDDFLVPCIEVICKRYGIPDEIAGATLLAVGSAAPELAIMSVATAYGQPDVGFDVLLISAMIAFGAIPACCVMAVGQSLTLEVRPLIRDTAFFSIGITLLFGLLCISGWEMGPSGCLALIGSYVAYLAVVAWPYISGAQGESVEDSVRKGSLEKPFLDTEANLPPLPPPHLHESKEGKDENSPDDTEDDSSKDEEAESGFAGALCNFVSKPFNKVFGLVLSAPDEDGPELSGRQVAWSTFASLVFLALLSKSSFDAVEALVGAFDLTGSAIGSTVLAFGSQIPDTIGAIAMTKAGMANGAISSAIGSQVLQVTLGVGAPWLLYNSFTGHTVQLVADKSFDSLMMLLPLTAVIILAYIALVILPALRRCSKETELHQSSGTMLCGLFGISIALSLVW